MIKKIIFHFITSLSFSFCAEHPVEDFFAEDKSYPVSPVYKKISEKMAVIELKPKKNYPPYEIFIREALPVLHRFDSDKYPNILSFLGDMSYQYTSKSYQTSGQRTMDISYGWAADWMCIIQCAQGLRLKDIFAGKMGPFTMIKDNIELSGVLKFEPQDGEVSTKFGIYNKENNERLTSIIFTVLPIKFLEKEGKEFFKNLYKRSARFYSRSSANIPSDQDKRKAFLTSAISIDLSLPREPDASDIISNPKSPRSYLQRRNTALLNRKMSESSVKQNLVSEEKGVEQPITSKSKGRRARAETDGKNATTSSLQPDQDASKLSKSKRRMTPRSKSAKEIMKPVFKRKELSESKTAEKTTSDTSSSSTDAGNQKIDQ